MLGETGVNEKYPEYGTIEMYETLVKIISFYIQRSRFIDREVEKHLVLIR